MLDNETARQAFSWAVAGGCFTCIAAWAWVNFWEWRKEVRDARNGKKAK